jgi:hypothetical protein
MPDFPAVILKAKSIVEKLVNKKENVKKRLGSGELDMGGKMKRMIILALCSAGMIILGWNGSGQAAGIAGAPRIAPGPVLVRVTTKAEGKSIPVQGIVVRFGGRYATTAADGSAILDGLPAGSHKLKINHRGFNRLEKDIALPAGKRDPLELSLVAETLADFSGLITVENTGQPLAGATIVLSPQAVTSEIQGKIAFSTQWDGKFIALQIPQGKYRLEISSPGCLPHSSEVEVAKEMPESKFALEREKKSRDQDVTVIDSVTGNPVAGAKTVMAECWPKGSIAEAVTDATGKAVFRGIQTGLLNWMDAQGSCPISREGIVFRVEAEGYEPVTSLDSRIPIHPAEKIAEQKPNGTLSQAQVIRTGAPVEFKIPKVGDKCFFRFRLIIPAAVKITVGPDNPIQTFVRLFTAAGDPLAEASAWAGSNNVMERRLRAGDYIIQVEEWGNDASSEKPLTLMASADYAADPFEPNDTPDEARLVKRNEEVRGRIFPTGDVDCFRFEVQRAAWHRFTMPAAGFQRYINIKDIQGKVLAEQGNWANAALDLQVQLAAGTYVLEVHEWGNDDSSLEPYTLRMESLEDDGIDDPPIEAGRPVAVRTLALNSLAGSTINPRGDFDTYAVPVPGPGVLHIEGLSVTQFFIQAFSPDGKLLAEQGNWARAPLHFAWHASGATTIYLRTYEWGSDDWSASPYKILNWFEPCDELDAMDRNDSFDTATPAFLGETLRGNINPIRDSDIYRFEVDQPGYLSVEGSGQTQLQIRIFDENQKQIAEKANWAGAPVSLHPQVYPGTYFVMIQEWGNDDWHSSPYAVDARLERAEPAERVPLPTDPVRLLSLGEAQSFAIDHLGDKDRFILTVPSAMKFSVGLWNSLQIYIRIFDDQTGAIVRESGNWANSNPKIDLEAKGPTRYRLEIEEWGNDDCSHQRQYILADSEGRALVAENIDAKVDPFNPTLVTFTRTPIKGIEVSAKVLLDARGDGGDVRELPAGETLIIRYPSEGLYAASASFEGANGTKTASRFWVEAVGAHERKGVFIVIDHPSEGQVVEKDEPVRARALSYSGAKIDKVTLAVDGRSLGTAYTPPYIFDVPWRNLGVGAHTLALTASDASGQKATLNRSVRVSDYFDLRPEDGAILTGNSIRVTWTGTSFGPAKVLYRPSGSSDWKEAVGENSRSRLVVLSDLEPGKAYEFQPVGGGQPGPPRKVTRVKGLAFGKTRYAGTIARDYDQKIGISVRNNAEKPLTVKLECGKPADDSSLLIGFVGEGSEGAPFVLQSGEEREFMLGISAQDVIQPTHKFPVRISSESGFADEAEVELNVILPDVRLEWELAGDKPDGIGRVFRLRNKGDGLTDLSVSCSSPEIFLMPSVEHDIFPKGATLEITATPRLYEGFKSVEGKLIARAVGKAVSTDVQLALKEGQSIFGVQLVPGSDFSLEDSLERQLLEARTLAGAYLDGSKVDWSRMERPEDSDGDGKMDRWFIEDQEEDTLWVGDDTDGDGEVDFVHADIGQDGQYDYSAIKSGQTWEQTNLVEAWLEMAFSLPWARSAYEKHDVDIVMNGVIIGRLRDAIPEGNHSFRLPPSALKFNPSGELEANSFEVHSRHLRGGHYVVASNFNIKYRLTGTRLWIVSGSREEAEKLARSSPGLILAGPNYSVSSAEMRLDGPAQLAKGVEAGVIVPVRNVGATGTRLVPVALLSSAPGAAGVEIARVEIQDVPLLGYTTVRLPWKATAGTHSLRVVVDPDNACSDVDRTNNEAMISVSVPGDDAKPTIKVLEPADGSAATETVVAIKAEADDDGGVSMVEARVDNGLWTRLSGVKTFEGKALLQPGSHTVSVRATDGSGNQVEQTVKVTIDVKPPEVQIHSPQDGAVLEVRQAEVKVSAGQEALLLALRVNGGPWHRGEAKAGQGIFAVPLSFGANMIEAAAIDKNGAMGLASVRVTCSKQPDSEEQISAAAAGKETGTIMIEGLGPVDMFGPPNRILPSAGGPEEKNSEPASLSGASAKILPVRSGAGKGEKP